VEVFKLDRLSSRRPTVASITVPRDAVATKRLLARVYMESGSMNTAFLLMAQYGGKAIVPIEDVCRDYFSHLNPTKLVQKISTGEIAIPLVRMEASQKCAKGIHLLDLAKYLDARVEAARKEMTALTT
jgi:Pyocin activator protein PrtN